MSNLVKSLAVLIASVIVVHLAYIGFIRPQADLVSEAARLAGQSAPRNIFVILKDYEQEICIILMLWAGYLIVSKSMEILKDRYLFTVDLLEDSEENGADLETVLSNLEALPAENSETPLVVSLMASLRRYLITSDVQNTSDAVESSIEALAIRQEAGNSMVRYLIWAIPSIGFIGTVRGIGGALALADQALAGDISGMTNQLGLAFNSTLVALLISIVLMFLLHQLQQLQDGLVVDTQAYCEKFLLKRISKR
ncbi:MAG: MotA/TolQ/ExbB proton channel family protein [Mariprofundaceae bacterium]|nr:MotA/TolQ/ExbB proton channel family protein [Mariprofundaceae bacterium]